MQSFLLDINVISETISLKPEKKVLNWLSSKHESSLYLSSLTLGEISKGIALLPVDNKRSEILLNWLETDLTSRFSGRIISVDAAIALKWGYVSGELQNKGRKASVIDGLIAVTALEYDLVLVTRNSKDFECFDIETFNPWNY